MSTRLVILGLLREKPLYGYEIKSLIEEQMGDWTNIAFGSIYFALGKMTEEGFIKRSGIEKEGSRPSRIVYSITNNGREEFQRLLRDIWKQPERQFYKIDIALYYKTALPQDEVMQYLKDRINYVRYALDHIDDHQKNQQDIEGIPAIAYAIFEHTRQHLQAEFTWLQKVLTNLSE